MVLDHSNNTDARGCTFSNVGRDQTNTTIINISLFGPRPASIHQQSHPPLHFTDDLSRPTAGLDSLSQGRLVIRPYNSSDAGSIVDSAVSLIVQITDLLIDRRDSSNNHRDLELELKSLHQTLTLTALGIQEYKDRPLGQSLAHTIAEETERCSMVLRELLDRVNDTWLGLSFTSIGDLWRPVWRSRWDGGELASLRLKLFGSRKSLVGFLVGLHSVAWMELGNELHAGHISLKRFHDLFSQRLPFMGHIRLNTVNVVSHLGNIIPVPNMFCSSWKDFHYIIQGYCKNHFGNRFIERGDYEVIRTTDSAIISRSEFASVVESGMILELSIVMRQRMAFQDDKKKCPRCGYVNLNVTTSNGWIECRKCMGQFQVAVVEWNDEGSSEMDGQEKNKYGEDNNKKGGEEHSEGFDSGSHDEIISPASYARQRANTEDLQPPDDSGTQFFRRIHVIWTVVGSLLLLHEAQVSGTDVQRSEAHMPWDLPTNDVGSKEPAVCDDELGNYIIVPDDLIARRYRTVKLLGQGTSSKVVEAFDTRNNTRVAIKIIRAIPKYRDASKTEVRVLQRLKERDPMNQHKCMLLSHWFDHCNHICLVSELLGVSVYDFLKENEFQPFPMEHIQSFARQLLGSIAFLHDLHLIHTDLKPENILLVHNSFRSIAVHVSGKQNAQPRMKRILQSTDIRLIDFGSAIFEEEYHSTVVSTRHYRAPEIILSLGWSFPCDAYSLGCILVEFYTGVALYQTHDNLEHLAIMEMVMGRMPDNFARAGARTKPEFFKGGNRLDWPKATASRQSKKDVRATPSLQDVIPPVDNINRHFMNLVQRLLAFDPSQRITIREAFNHPYFALSIPADV